MEIRIRKADCSDVEEIGRLYDALCEYLAQHINYPGWEKGSYPSADTARRAAEEGTLYAAECDGKIVGTVILRHEPEPEYAKIPWLTENCYERIYVVYTLAVHPDALHSGVGEALLRYAEALARSEGCISLRLDMVKGNVPAERLYRKCGFLYLCTASLGYECYGLPRFDLYEKLL